MNHILSFLLISTLFSLSLNAQKSWVSGTLIEKETKETLAGVSIYQHDKLSTMTDANGSFTLAFDKGEHDFYAQLSSSKTLINIQIEDVASYNLGAIPLDIEDEGAGFKKVFKLTKSSNYFLKDLSEPSTH